MFFVNLHNKNLCDTLYVNHQPTFKFQENINLYGEAYWEEREGAKGPLSRALQAPKGSQALRRSEKEGATLTFSFK